MNRFVRSTLAAAALLAAANPADAQVRLLRDLHTTPRAGVFGPHAMFSIGARLVFARDSPGTGLESWVCCLPDTGAVLLADINPGECAGSFFTSPGSSFGRWAAARLPDGLAFVGVDPSHGFELWVTDGEPSGTRRVELDPFISSFPEWFTTLGDSVFFAGRSSSGRELWRTDGTPAGTLPLGGPKPTYLAALGNDLLFAAEGVEGVELWASDGTAGGTRLISDLAAGTASSFPRDILAADTFAYFSADDGSLGRELYRSDGVLTELVSDVRPGPEGSDPRPLAAIGGSMFFATLGPGPGELWVSDGTAGGTIGLGELDPIWYRSPGVLGGRLIFSGDDGSAGHELWSSDGSPAGTELLLDISPGPEGSRPHGFVEFQGRMFFSADDGLIGRELWVTDGSPGGTELFLDVDPTGSGDVGFLTVVGNALFFAANDGAAGFQLWRSDGTASGTRRLTEAEGNDHSRPRYFTDLGGQALFEAWDPIAQSLAIFVSDGTEAGTVPVTEAPRIDPEPVVMGGRAFFGGDAGGETEPWVSDGTPSGTHRLKDIEPTGSSQPDRLTVVDDSLFFTARTESTGLELWRSDGSEAGTALVKDIDPAGSSAPSGLTSFRGALFFTARDADGDRELWSSDGTEGGTTRFLDLNPSGSGRVLELTAAGDRLFFLGDDGSPGRQLWVSDGTPGNATSLGEVDGSAPYLTAFGQGVFFPAADPTTGEEPWVSDGTPAGTGLLLDIRPGPDSSVPGAAVAVGPALFFTAWPPGIDAQQLWVSDGTPGGTRSLTDFAPGAYGIEDLTPVKRRLYFVADDGASGRALWISDGTVEGTRIVWDPPGEDPCALIDELSAIGEELYFSASDIEHGREPWAARHFDIIVNDGVSSLAAALDELSDPAILGAPVANASECGRTRLASGRRWFATPDELASGIDLSDGGGPLLLIEVAEWCGCSADPAEPPPADASELRDDILVLRGPGGLVVRRQARAGGAACP